MPIKSDLYGVMSFENVKAAVYDLFPDALLDEGPDNELIISTGIQFFAKNPQILRAMSNPLAESPIDVTSTG